MCSYPRSLAGSQDFDGKFHTLRFSCRLKEPTFLGDILLTYLIFCLYNPYVRDGGSVSLIKTCKDCIFITVAFSPIGYFILKLFLSKCYTKFQPSGSYGLGSFMRVSIVLIFVNILVYD